MSIKIQAISKKFNNVEVLKKIDLEIRDNETTVIVGPSGSGKSTLLRCMNLLEIPDSGSISIGTQQVDFSKKLGKSEILAFRRRTGMVFQGFHLFPHRTVLENITEGPIYVLGKKKQEAEEQAQMLLDQVGLAGKAQEYPNYLSGGQQQRVAIARALALEPEFLLFDEPTSALDPELEFEVLKVISNLAKNERSQIIVTHNMNFARRVADRILFLENGKIAFDGTPEEFFHTDNERIKRFISAVTFEVE